MTNGKLKEFWNKHKGKIATGSLVLGAAAVIGTLPTHCSNIQKFIESKQDNESIISYEVNSDMDTDEQRESTSLDSMLDSRISDLTIQGDFVVQGDMYVDNLNIQQEKPEINVEMQDTTVNVQQEKPEINVEMQDTTVNVQQEKSEIITETTIPPTHYQSPSQTITIEETTEEVIEDSEPKARLRLETVSEVIERYNRTGDLDVTLIKYNNGQITSLNLDYLTIDDIKDITQHIEGTAIHYDEGLPDLNEILKETIRNVTIPTSHGNIELYNLGYIDDPNSKNFEIRFSTLTEIIKNSDGETISYVNRWNRDQHGLPRGFKTAMDSRENIHVYRESFGIEDKIIQEEDLDQDLRENLRNGSRLYMIFPRSSDEREYSRGLIASVPEGIENVSLESIYAMFGISDYEVITREIRREAETQREKEEPIYIPRDPITPERPEPERPDNQYRFDRDARKPDHAREYNPLDTMRTLPSEEPGRIMDDHNTGVSETPITGENETRPRPTRPLR